MSVVIEEQIGRPFRVPGYAGYVPGLKYSFGHTYGYVESQLFKSQHPNFKASDYEKVQLHEPLFRQTRAVDSSCLYHNGVHQKLSKISDVQAEQRRVQWTDNGMGTVDNAKHEESSHSNAYVQCKLEEVWGKDAEREGLRSAATQWSDQEAGREKKSSAATQWSPADFSPLKTIPGYTGHLPGRHNVNPGKTFCQEMDTLLRNFHPKSEAVVPISRHNLSSALQQVINNKPAGKDDPYFDNRPPSTYLNNYPIPGYQGFVPRVRTSTSGLGIRYIKAVEKSLHALHEQQHHHMDKCNEELLNSPQKLLVKRPPHTPRHRPHPKQEIAQQDDWRVVYNRPPSTYLDLSKTYIPGYKGFIPHLRGSPNAVGMRYSKAAMGCVERALQQAHEIQSRQETHKEAPRENEDDIKDYGDTGSDSEDDASKALNNRLERRLSEERPYRQQHSHYIRDRKPSTYKSDARHPIPGYQGFIPRLRDSPTTLGLRYTKAALKTLQDLHDHS